MIRRKKSLHDMIETQFREDIFGVYLHDLILSGNFLQVIKQSFTTWLKVSIPEKRLRSSHHAPAQLLKLFHHSQHGVEVFHACHRYISVFFCLDSSVRAVTFQSKTVHCRESFNVPEAGSVLGNIPLRSFPPVLAQIADHREDMPFGMT